MNFKQNQKIDQVKNSTLVSRDYILGNWAGIMQWVRDKNKEAGCSAEGHVNHIYADRMSSRALGWRRTGVD